MTINIYLKDRIATVKTLIEIKDLMLSREIPQSLLLTQYLINKLSAIKGFSKLKNDIQNSEVIIK